MWGKITEKNLWEDSSHEKLGKNINFYDEFSGDQKKRKLKKATHKMRHVHVSLR